MNSFNLQGKVALVTGAGRGIGKALAIGLAEAGADVICVARTESEIAATASEIESLGCRSEAIRADIAAKAQVESAVSAALATFGKIDILINNAGTNIRTSALEVTEHEWDQVVDTNLRGPFFMAQAVGREMCRAGYGRVINISSVGGSVALRTGVAYGSSKAGMNHMTRILAMEWARHGVTVNAVGPWYFRTSLTEKILQNDAFVAEIVSRTPMRRIGDLKELVGPVVFLASAASSYITGQCINIDGGMSIFGF